MCTHNLTETTMQVKTILFTLGTTALLGLTGCTTQSKLDRPDYSRYLPGFLQPYRAPVTQGNLVTSDMVAQLAQGMSVAQVQYILGLPVLRDQFHPTRWDYVYFYLPTRGEKQLRRLTVFFTPEGRVDYWESDPMPTEEQADALILGTIKTFTPDSSEPAKAQ